MTMLLLLLDKQQLLVITILLTTMKVSNGITIDLKNGDKYTGEVRNGKPHGQGTLTNKYDEKYTGIFQDGVMRGNFFVEYPSGNTYEGGIYGDGKRNGTGHFTWTSGIEYTGDWLDGNQQGYGVKTWGPGSRWAGDRYEGEFRNNVRTGQGAYYWHNGDVYRGGYKDDSQHGFGVLTWASGEWLEYKGEWSGGKFNGYGRLSYKDQSFYIGFWKDSNREGEGLKMWINGVSFYGRMRNDSYFHGMIMNGDTSFIFSPFQNSASHGKGFKVANATHGNVDCIEYNQANEAARSCHRLPDEVKQIFYSNFDFYEGDVITRRGQEKSDGFGEFKADNGSYYIGEWKDGAQDGFGLMRDPVERTLVGTFRNGVLNGAGASLSYSTKFRTIHFGGWSKGWQDGPGLFIYPNGDKVLGYFNNGRLDHSRNPIFVHYNGTKEELLYNIVE